MKKVFTLIAALCLLVSVSAMAQPGDYPEFDHNAVKEMSKAERLAYQQAYKAQLEEIARSRGWEPTTKPLTKTDRQAPKFQRAPEVPGTMLSYHSGAVAAGGTSSFMVGNQYDTGLTVMGGLGPAEMSGSVTMATFSLVNLGGTAAFFSMADQLAGTVAMNVTSMSFPGLAIGVNTLTFASPLNYVGSSFLAGIWNFGSDSIALATGTTGGQGFHAMEIDDNSTTLMSFMTIPSANAVMAVQGDVATPVELKSFSID